MSVKSIIASYSPEVKVNWLAKLTASPTSTGWGRDIEVDSSGNVYVTGIANNSTTTASYVFIAKYNASGSLQWKTTLDTPSQPDIGYKIAVNSLGEVFVTGQTNTSTASRGFVAKYDSSGNPVWQRTLGSYFTAGYGITVDSSNNVYVVGIWNYTSASTGTASSANNGFLIKYDTNGVVQFKRNIFSNSGAIPDACYDVAVSSAGNIYISCISPTGSANGLRYTIKLDSTGTILWQRALGTASTYYATGQGLTIDASENVYITGGVAGTAASNYAIVVKYDTNGNIQWQRYLDRATNADAGFDIAVDNLGYVYVVGCVDYTNTSTNADFFIAKYKDDGTFQWQRFLKYTSGAIEYGFGIAVDTIGNMYVTGRYAANNMILIAKLPSDGTIPGTGSYSLGGTVVTYIAGDLTTGTPTLTDAAGSLLCDATYNDMWINNNTAANGTDIINAKGIISDSSGNTYAVLYINNLNSAYLGKYDTNGARLWGKSLGTTTEAFFNAVALDSSGNVYTVGYSTGASAAGFAIYKYNSSGVMQWQQYLHDSTNAATGENGNAIAVDSSGNVYFTGAGNSSGGAYYHAPVVKYDTNGNVQWRRKLYITSVDTIGRSIAVDSSGNCYITGQANGTSTVSYAFTVKYNTSGSLQWHKKLETTSQLDSGNSIALDSSGNVYITGQANSTTNAYAFVAKYDNSGNIQWRRKIDVLSNLDVGVGIAIDSSNYIYVTGRANATTGANSYTFIAKYDSSGTIIWKRKLDFTAKTDTVAGITVDNLGYYYLLATPNTTSAFIIKLPTDGSWLGANVNTVGDFSYSVATFDESDASSILADSVSTLSDADISSTLVNLAISKTGADSLSLSTQQILNIADSAGSTGTVTTDVLSNTTLII